MKYMKVVDGSGRRGLFPLQSISHILESDEGWAMLVTNVGIVYTFPGIPHEKAAEQFENLCRSKEPGDGVYLVPEEWFCAEQVCNQRE